MTFEMPRHMLIFTFVNTFNDNEHNSIKNSSLNEQLRKIKLSTCENDSSIF